MEKKANEVIISEQTKEELHGELLLCVGGDICGGDGSGVVSHYIAISTWILSPLVCWCCVVCDCVRVWWSIAMAIEQRLLKHHLPSCCELLRKLEAILLRVCSREEILSIPESFRKTLTTRTLQRRLRWTPSRWLQNRRCSTSVKQWY